MYQVSEYYSIFVRCVREEKKAVMRRERKLFWLSDINKLRWINENVRCIGRREEAKLRFLLKEQYLRFLKEDANLCNTWWWKKKKWEWETEEKIGHCLKVRVSEYGLPDYAQTIARRYDKVENVEERTNKRKGGRKREKRTILPCTTSWLNYITCHSHLRLPSAILLHVLALSNVAPGIWRVPFDRSIYKTPLSKQFIFTFFLFFFHYHSWYISICGLFRCFVFSLTRIEI